MILFSFKANPSYNILYQRRMIMDSSFDSVLQVSKKVELILKNEVKSNVVLLKVSDRPRKSVYPMISVTEALSCVLKESETLEQEYKNALDCFSHILAKDLIATEPYPSFRASIKDGYAVLADDITDVRKVIGTVTPGCELDFNLESACCVRVSTGSAIPTKADAVIQVEDTIIFEKDDEGHEIKIKILKQVSKFQDIRPVGSDVKNGETIIPALQKISAAEIGVMATCGIQKALVYQKPLVALLSTGDEILEPGVPLLPGCIRDSNKSSLLFLLKENRIAAVDVGIAKDMADDIKLHLLAAFETADIIVSTGSVSMGEKDMLKQVLEVDFSAVIHFGRIHMKPGKPTTFSTVNYNGKKKLVFSLPGNPVSAYVCFYLFVIPCIKKLMGYKDPTHSTVKVKLAHDIRLDERPEFYRARLRFDAEGSLEARGTGSQQSSRLLSMQNADALLVLPTRAEGRVELKTGTRVDAILLRTI